LWKCLYEKRKLDFLLTYEEYAFSIDYWLSILSAPEKFMNFDPKMAKIEHVKQAKDGLDVWSDIFKHAEQGFSAIPEDDFARMRWYGIYQQKPNEGHFMWRIKLPGGRVTPAQLREIGHLANDYGRGIADITTRQDIQLHWLSIENFPDALKRIYNKVGLYTDFACGDTPRNACSCPLDGIIKNQIIDLGDTVQKLSDMFRASVKRCRICRGNLRPASRRARCIVISHRLTMCRRSGLSAPTGRADSV
jgi:hypothetical protein